MMSMLCPVMVDRVTEIRTVSRSIDKAARGTGGMLFVAGEPGVGKSRMAREAASAASENRFNVLIGRATEAAVPVPFRPVAEALMKVARAGVTPDAPELENYRPALATLVPEWGQPGQAGRDAAEISPLILGEAVIRLLMSGDFAGTLLVLEDLQWADPETLALVDYLADSLARSTILCLATVRDNEPSAGLDAVRSIAGRRAATVIELRRLGDRSTIQMAEACLGSQVPQQLSELLADCEGLPFAVEEMLASAAASGHLVRREDTWHVDTKFEAGVPASIAGSVRNRIAALGSAAADVLAGAAMLGRKFDWALLPHIAELADTEVLAALRQAQGMQLIEPIPDSGGLFRFRHSLTRHAILSDLLPPARARRAARAAAAIEKAYPGLPGSTCELAAELHSQAGDRPRAAALLLESGCRALRNGALSTALTSLRDARALLVPDASEDPSYAASQELLLDIDEGIVEALALAGNYADLRPVAHRLIASLDAAGADPRRQARVLITVARTRCEDHKAESAADLATARQIADGLHDPVLSSQVDAADASCAIETGDMDRADTLARRALASAQAAGLRGWAADVAFDALTVLGRRERFHDFAAARDAFERAYGIATHEHSAIRRIAALHELGTIDMLREGRTDGLLQAGHLARESGAISTATTIDLQLAIAWSVSADLDRSLEMAQKCEQEARQIGARRTEALAVAVQAVVAALRSDRRSAVRTAERAEKVAEGDQEILFTTWGVARVTASLMHDDVPRAVRESETAIGYAGETSLILPRRTLAYYAILQAVAGKHGREAIDRARETGAAVGWNQAYLAYAQAVLEGREGHRDQADHLAAAGSRLLAPYGPWWNHLARRLVAPDALRDGWGAPADWLREAAADFEHTGHHQLATACRGLLRQAGEKVPRTGRGTAQVPPQMRRLGITSREMDVFLLLARGYSNPQIANRLFISPKTVETHVASLVHKTGQHSRRELVAHAARIASADGT